MNNSYMNEKTCESQSNTRKRQRLHILNTVTTHGNEYNKKGFSQKNINTNNTSVFAQMLKNAYERVFRVAWERGCANIIALCMLWRKLRAIM